MGPSVLWIDAKEVAELLGEQVPRKASSQLTARQLPDRARGIRQFRGPDSKDGQASTARPRSLSNFRQARTFDATDADQRQRPLVEKRRPAAAGTLKQPAVELPSAFHRSATNRAKFEIVVGATLEDELDRLLAWIEARVGTTVSFVADGQGLVVAVRGAALSLSQALAGRLSGHLDEITALAARRLHGFLVLQMPSGFLSTTWVELNGRRMFLVLECERALSAAESEQMRQRLVSVFKETTK